MPTFVHGKGTAVYLDEFTMTDYFNSADVALTNDTAEVTAYGATSKSYLLGLADGRGTPRHPRISVSGEHHGRLCCRDDRQPGDDRQMR